MTEDEARDWLTSSLDVSRETLECLAAYAALVEAEQANQNLVSASTLPHFWARHIVDSAQLIVLAGDRACCSWLDIGSGAGIPGIVIAILTDAPVILVEPRARRAAFLVDAANALNLTNIRVAACSVEKLVAEPVDIVTARAVAALPSLVARASRFARKETLWLLPKGKSAKAELESLPKAWHGVWSTQQSVTDPESYVLIGRNIRTSGKR